MRLAFLGSLLLVVLVACGSSHSTSSESADSGDEGGEDDGSTAGCTSLGGTCESFAAGCPVLQQNPELCGNVVLVCCLPPGGEMVTGAEGGETGAEGGETGGEGGESADAGIMMTDGEAGPEGPPTDASLD